MATGNTNKEVLYVDVDDEITAIIEKVKLSKAKIVALVLPKRATVFQSTVNMKLLKRSATTAKKSLVLITSESSLLPLAGVVGLHVASTLQSKPAIPAAPQQSTAPISDADIEVGEPQDVPINKAAPVGDLASKAVQEDEEPIEVDNDEGTGKAAAAAGAGAKKSFNKKLKVPNFDKFRTRLFLIIGLLVVLIIGLILAAVVLPKATISIRTNATEVASAIRVTSSPSFEELDTDNNTLPGLLKEYKKTEVQKVPATGEKDLGTKATGKIAVFNCTDNVVTIPAGTTFTNTGSNFSTTEVANIPASDFFSNGTCKKNKTTDVSVVAAEAGDKYNFSSGRTYTTTFASTLGGTGSTMSGGTSKIVKVVSQQDIDNAKQKAAEATNAVGNQEVSKLLKDEGFFPITDTFAAKDPIVTSNPGVNAEATEVTVSVTLTYTMAGANREDLEKLLEAEIKKHIDTSQQNILNNGLDTASTRIDIKKPSGETTFELDVKATAGVEQNADQIKEIVKGKKKSEAEAVIRSRPGIEEVNVKYSPFWVSKVPSNQDKITVVFEQPSTQL